MSFMTCHLISWPLSSPIDLCCAGEIRKALAILLFYSHVSGGISEAFSLSTYHEVASNLLRALSPSIMPYCFLPILLCYLLPGYVTFYS